MILRIYPAPGMVVSGNYEGEDLRERVRACHELGMRWEVEGKMSELMGALG